MREAYQCQRSIRRQAAVALSVRRFPPLSQHPIRGIRTDADGERKVRCLGHDPLVSVEHPPRQGTGHGSLLERRDRCRNSKDCVKRREGVSHGNAWLLQDGTTSPGSHTQYWTMPFCLGPPNPPHQPICVGKRKRDRETDHSVSVGRTRSHASVTSVIP